MLTLSSHTKQRTYLSRTARKQWHLPVEIIDLIASSVDHRQDLVSFALSCHAHKQVAIPRYSEYRIIRSPLQSPIWAHLAARPDLGRNIQVLDILCDHISSACRPHRVPTTWVDPSHASLMSATDVTDAFVNALRSMESLHTFSWATDFKFHLEYERTFEENIWSALQHNKSLRHVEFSDPSFNRSFYHYDNFHRSANPLWGLSNLTSLSLINGPYLYDTLCGSNFRCMLVSSPMLEVLCIRLDYRLCNINPVFSGIHWPRLRKLSLKIFADPRVHGRVFANFLECHPTLEDVEWQYLHPINLRSGSLPLLRQLSTADDGNGILEVIRHPTTPPRAIQSLGKVPLNTRYLIALKNIDRNVLHKLELHFFESLDSLRSVADMFPNLMWLRVPSVDYQHDYTTATYSSIHMGEWAELLPLFPRLEVFHGVSFLKDVEPYNNDDRAADLKALCPHLRRIDHWGDTSDIIVIIHQEGSRVTWREMLVYNYVECL